VVLGLYWKRATLFGVFAGIVVGVSTVALLVLSNQDPFFGFNAGFVALCLNFLVCVPLSLSKVSFPARDSG
jgi:solute:Na+ symporter, SSS family